jgi:ribosomal protein S18 acetylase RimI-like enzyme
VIRDFLVKDTIEINDLIKNVDTGYEVDDVKDIQSSSDKFIVYELEHIKGFAYVTMITNDANEKEAQIKLYVEPRSRLQGIGRALYHRLEDFLTEREPDLLSAYIRVDIENPSLFCEKIGFHKWWGSPELLFKGYQFPQVGLEFVAYEDKYFDQYVKVVQEAYYEIHKSNDLKPYLATAESVGKYQLNNKEQVYLALENDRIIASVTIGEGTIDNLMVPSEYQGQGYGRKALQFAMNKLFDQGFEEIRICYMEGNDSAEKLYESLGFRPLQMTHVYRKFINGTTSFHESDL